MADPAPPAPSNSPPATHPRSDETLQPIAAVLAALFPGAGHAYMGEFRRAILIAAGVLGMFFGGIFIGGIDVVDRREDFVWFLGQAMVGPLAFGADSIHQNRFKAIPLDPSSPPRSVSEVLRIPRRSANPNEKRVVMNLDLQDFSGRLSKVPTAVFVPAGQGEGPPNVKSLGRANEIGTLMSTVAGMMNLIVIIDAAWHRPRRRSEPAVRKGAW